MSAEVVAKAKLCLIDSLSGSLTVGAMLEDRCALALAEHRGAAAQATVVGTAVMTAPSDAAFVNAVAAANTSRRSEEHTSELQSLMRISYAVFSCKKKNTKTVESH